MNSNHPKRREYLWYFAPLIVWIIIILIASTGTGSMSNTSRIIRPLLEFLIPEITDESIRLIQVYIRKTAHFTFYGVLGFLAARAYLSELIAFLRRNLFVSALLTVIIIAAIDETNQSFNQSRTGSIYDVLLDIAGGLTAICVTYFWARRKKSD